MEKKNPKLFAENSSHKEGFYTGGDFHATESVVIIGSTDISVVYNKSANLDKNNLVELKELFTLLNKQIDVSTLPSGSKNEAKEAAQLFAQEVEQIKKDPKHKPNKFQMIGFREAFRKLGAPVFNVAMKIIGYEALGQAVNQFAENLSEDTK